MAPRPDVSAVNAISAFCQTWLWLLPGLHGALPIPAQAANVPGNLPAYPANPIPPIDALLQFNSTQELLTSLHWYASVIFPNILNLAPHYVPPVPPLICNQALGNINLLQQTLAALVAFAQGGAIIPGPPLPGPAAYQLPNFLPAGGTQIPADSPFELYLESLLQRVVLTAVGPVNYGI